MTKEQIIDLFGKFPETGDVVGYDNGNGENLPVVCYRSGNTIEFTNSRFKDLPEDQRNYTYEDFLNVITRRDF